MTSLSLLLWIVAAIVLQVAIFLAIGFWHHWRNYQSLRGSLAAYLAGPAAPPEPNDVGAAAWTGYRTFRVDRKVVEDAAQSVCSFYLVPEDGEALPPFLPGQFLTFRLELPKVSGDSEQIVRCYSLSDAPRPEAYRVSIKRLPFGRSSNFFHDHVRVGSRLQVRAPAGHFYLDRSDSPVVLIGGGIGITPLLSMLNWCLAEQPGREIWLFYGLRHGRELVMGAALKELAAAHPNFHLHLCYSDPEPADQLPHEPPHRGRIDLSLLRLKLPLKPYHFYICGPAPLMESLVPALEEWGVPDSRIHFEAFGPASVKLRPAAAGLGTVPAPRRAVEAADIVVTFARSGRQFAWRPGAGSLLEFAETNGVGVDSGCRAGGCGTCQTTIRAGEVVYRQTPDYDPDPGSCLLCVCEPKTSVTLEV